MPTPVTVTATDRATTAAVSRRDRAILAAVDAGRCVVMGTALLVDGRCCADQFAGARLRAAGWIEIVERLDATDGVVVPGVALAALTDRGRDLLTA